MSIEQPDARALLVIARETLLAEVLPRLDGDTRYQALMVANAMAIAIRELQPELCDLEHEVRLLRALYGDSGSDSGSDGDGEGDSKDPGQQDGPECADKERELRRLERRLADELRNGSVDSARERQLRQVLRARTNARLALSNPRRLSPVRQT